MIIQYKNIVFLGFYQLYKKNAYIFNNEKEPIHVVGNGWASYHFVKNLNKNKYIPIIISPNEFILNTPKLISQLDNPDKKKINFSNDYGIKINDYVVDIDPVNKVIYTSNSNYCYRNLVLAIGSEVNDFGIKGVDSNTIKLKSINDLDRLRKELIENNSSVNLKEKKIFVIGGGPTGIELVSKLKNIGYDPILLESMNNILNDFKSESKTIIYNYLVDELDIKIKLDETVKEITNKYITTKKNTYPYDLAIWVGGVKLNGYKKTNLYSRLDSISKITPRGIEVKDDFSIENSIYCIGDIVSNKGPPTAQNAKYQARWLAEYLNKNKSDKLDRYEVKELGKIIHLENKIYLESKYYSGFICKYLEDIIDFFYKL